MTLPLTDSLTDYSPLLNNTTIEHFERLVTLETCHQSDEKTQALQDNDNDNNNNNNNDNDNDNDNATQPGSTKLNPTH